VIEKRSRRRRDGSRYVVWRVRWRDEAGAERSKTFDRAADARAFEAKLRLLKRAGALAEMDAGLETLAEFVEEWWSVYAGPNLERATLRVYAGLWNSHALPRLGHLKLRELTPQAIARFRADLEADGVGIEAIRKTMTMLQGVLQRAVEWGRVPTNAVKLTRKPPKPHRPAVQAIPPAIVELMRARLLDEGRLRDATLLVVLAYAGLRPQEALALEWRHVRERTLLVERAVSDGQLKALKNRRQPRTVALLSPLRDDLAIWRRASLPAAPSSPLFPSGSGGFWRASDWRNWRKRAYRPVAEQVGIDGARPYELRHAFASLLIHEGRLSVVDIAAQLGHNPTVCLDTYAHVMAEQRGAEPMSAEQQILRARRRHEATGQLENAPGQAPAGDTLPAPAAAVEPLAPSRISICRAEPHGYWVEFTYQGATSYADAEHAERALRAARLQTRFREEFDGGWTVRFGPLPREQMHALLDHFG
jgi:integrase